MNPITDDDGRELQPHGTYDFPCGCYHTSGGGFPWHWHNEMEMLYVESGVLIFAVTNQRYTLHPGDGIVVNGNVPHAVYLLHQQHYEENDIVFHPRLLYGGVDTVLFDKYFRVFLQDAGLGGIPLYCKIDWQRAAAEEIQKACQACFAKEQRYEFVVREALTNTYLAVWEHTKERLGTESSCSSLRGDRVKGMMRYLETNLGDAISLEDLSWYAKLSSRACQREFQAYLGITPSQYLGQVRLSRAAELLRSGAHTITEVCYQCGFHDSSYFAKQFRLRYGVSPREYQQKR